METNEILQKLTKCINSVITNNTVIIEEKTKFSSIKGWDSFSHINIIREIEKTFCIRFSLGEIVTLRTISDIIKLIEQKTK